MGGRGLLGATAGGIGSPNYLTRMGQMSVLEETLIPAQGQL